MHTEESQPPSYNFQEGALLLVNKPKSWTSFDVVNKLRSKLKYHLGLKKIKVGHAGTLDPMATGLLLICTGRFTKKLGEFQDLGKVYTGTFLLGATTPSFDAETEIDGHYPYAHITPEDLERVRAEFTGELDQVPPIFSAIKVDGQPLYKRARRGEMVKIDPRRVHIYSLVFTRIALPEVDFRVHCSKGTYIRSLVHDIGKALGSGAYLTALCRTQIGDHDLQQAWELEQLVDHIEAVSAPQQIPEG